MKKLLLALALVLAPGAAFAAPTLSWDAVTTGTDGLPLDPGVPVLGYNVYRCPMATPGNVCVPSAATLIATTGANTTSIDFASELANVPALYAVTAFNVVGESLLSDTLKVTKPGKPTGQKVQ